MKLLFLSCQCLLLSAPTIPGLHHSRLASRIVQKDPDEDRDAELNPLHDEIARETDLIDDIRQGYLQFLYNL